MMDSMNIEYSVVSVSSPGVHLTAGDDAAAIDLCRKCNQFAAGMKKRHPKRFGYFASLPLPAVEASLKEIETAFAEGADGIVFLTNFHGVYLGDRKFDRVMDELNRRKAKIFIHPTCGCLSPAGHTGAGTANTLQANPLFHVMPNPVVEFLFDTSRCIANLFLSGTVRRCPDITWLISHMGGSLAPIVSRFAAFAPLVGDPQYIRDDLSEDEVVEIFNQRFFFDMAGWSFPRQWKMLTYGLGIGFDRITYGSDFPFTNAMAVAAFGDKMDEGVKEWKERVTEDAYYANAAKLFGLAGIDKSDRKAVL